MSSASSVVGAFLMSELSRLRWKCRRGMKELDLLLERYLAGPYVTASVAQQQAFALLLDLPDPELAACLIGGQPPADTTLTDVIHAIRTIT